MLANPQNENSTLGDLYAQKNLIDSAAYYYQLDIDRLEQDSSILVADIYDKLGLLYRKNAYFDKAYQNFQKSLNIRVTRGEGDLALSHLLLSTAAGRMKKDSVAIDHSRAAIGYALISKDTLRLSQAYNNLGAQFYDLSMSDSISVSKEFVWLTDSALKYLKKAILFKGYLEEAGIDTRIQNTWNNLSLVYENKRMYDSAKLYSHKALERRKQISDTVGMLTSYRNLGLIYYLDPDGSLDSSYFYYAKGIKMSDQYPSGSYQKQNLYLALSKYFEAVHKFDSAHYYFKKYNETYRSLYNEKNAAQMNELIATYQSELKDSKIKTQESEIKRNAAQRDFLIVVSILIVAFSVAIMIFSRKRRKSILQIAKKNKEIDGRKINELLKDIEIKSISSMLIGQEKERKRVAEDLHDRLGSTLATIKLHFNSLIHLPKENHTQFLKVNELLDAAVEEIREIAHNLLSGVLTKFGLVAALNDLKNSVDSSKSIRMEVIVNNLDDRLDKNVELNLYRIIQESVSNTLKHAQATEIIIQLTRHDSELTVTIEDDGIGFDFEKLEGSHGMGLKNMEGRLSSLDGRLNIDSGKGNGTMITLDIPML